LGALPLGLVANRRRAVSAVPNFAELRRAGREIRNHTLAHLDLYLEAFETSARAAGAIVHWARDACEARAIVADICRNSDVRRIVKSKSMVSEEIGLNAHLESCGFQVVETDLGEYIIQNRGEMPSHIIAPAIHLTPLDVAADFRRLHTQLDPARPLATPESLVAEARGVLRAQFLAADAGITGANFLIAETGGLILVTNEGNADLCHTLPRVHIAVTGIDKVVPTLDDVSVLLRLLARSATGQDMTAYTTHVAGPRRANDVDGPQACHVVLVDNGRSELLGSPLRDVLRCIRCGACMNHCPVYNAIGGHAYASVYPGPIGAVLTPLHQGIAASADLPNASTFCGACEAVCPVEIPLTRFMRIWRERAVAAGTDGIAARAAFQIWSALVVRPRLYHLLTRFLAAIGGAAGRSKGRFRRLPVARGWLRHRDMPAPQGRTFQQLWQETERGVPR
jgi:L-lactate dehydrogenase complex protein LldF